MKQNVIMLQMPTEVVRNIGFKINDKTFAVYAYLTYVKFRSYEQGEFEFNHNSLKKVTGISDNRTLKKCFDQLHDNGLIKNSIEKFPSSRISTIKTELTTNYKQDWFTQLPASMLKRINEIDTQGFRLLYYYESFINRKIVTKDYCYPSYKTIVKDLSIGNDTLSKYNDILITNKYITVTKHEVEVDDVLEFGSLTRYNNHYKVNLHNMVKEGM